MSRSIIELALESNPLSEDGGYRSIACVSYSACNIFFDNLAELISSSK